MEYCGNCIKFSQGVLPTDTVTRAVFVRLWPSLSQWELNIRVGTASPLENSQF